MAIHQNDDYSLLAELLYPSVDASGNVYYGQTKKLMLDEVFNKNDLGFESHIETFRDPDNSDNYYSYFCWRIGPLKGSVEVNLPLSNTLKYARYKLNVNRVDNKEVTKAGPFSTYYNNITCQYDSTLFLEDNLDPTEENDYDGRNFYIVKENDGVYLYVVLALHSQLESFTSSSSNSEDDSGSNTGSDSGNDSGSNTGSGDDSGSNTGSDSGDDSNVPQNRFFTIKAVGGDIDVTFTDPHQYQYLVKLDEIIIRDPNEIQEDERVLDSITVNEGQSLKILCTSNVTSREAINAYDASLNGHRHFNITGNGTADISGELSSLQPIVEGQFLGLDASRFSFLGLFEWCQSSINICDLNFPHTAPVGCYSRMFRGCANLMCYDTSTGEHVSKNLTFTSKIGNGALSSMFEGCSSLEVGATVTCSSDMTDSCFARMYYGCTNLSSAAFDVVTSRLANIDAFEDFLTYAGENGHDNPLYLSSSIGKYFRRNETSNLPSNWRILPLSSLTFNNTRSVMLNSNSTSLTVTPQMRALTDDISQNLTSTEERPTYKRDVMITSGANTSETYGRGDVSNKSTVGNMKQVSPLNDPSAPKMDTYSNDGSYNQDIWGLKCFNGPVVFRNGIYGETGCLIAKNNTLTIRSYGDSSTIILDADCVQFNGTTTIGFGGSGSSQIAGDTSSLKYGGTKVIEATNASTTTLKSNLIPDRDGTRDIGSSSNKLNNVYAKSLTGCLPISTDANIRKYSGLTPGSICFVILNIQAESTDNASEFCSRICTAVGKTITFDNHSTSYIQIGNDRFNGYKGSMSPLSLRFSFSNDSHISGTVKWNDPMMFYQQGETNTEIGSRTFTLLSSVGITYDENNSGDDNDSGFWRAQPTTLADLQDREHELSVKKDEDTRRLGALEDLENHFFDPNLTRGFDAYLNSKKLIEYGSLTRSMNDLLNLRDANTSSITNLRNTTSLSQELINVADEEIPSKIENRITTIDSRISTINNLAIVKEYNNLTSPVHLKDEIQLSVSNMRTALGIL